MNRQEPILKSLAVIEEKIQEKLTVESLAGSLHFSRYHYQRLFREAVGESVMRYVARRRIFLAAKELASTDLSILEIALKYGYDSHEGFSRSFKAYVGVTPKEYRKYHASIGTPETEKERCVMLYSKTTDEIIRELNSLIVELRQAAGFTRKIGEKQKEAAAFFGEFFQLLAARADQMAGGLSGSLEGITNIARCPDQISARFLIIKAIEDAAFWTSITDFQVRLTIARAKPQHRALFEPLCRKYEDLAQNARMKAGKIADFLGELSALIFQDMRENAAEKLQNAIWLGESAAKRLLEDDTLPYSWLGDELLTIVGEISKTPVEEVEAGLLEDWMFRTDIIAFAADVDLLRAPSHKLRFGGISDFREGLREAFSFFQGLSEDIFGESREPGQGQPLERTEEKRFNDLAFQGNILFFYLKGETQKLGDHLDENQKSVFDGICEKLGTAIVLAQQAERKSDAEQIGELLKAVYTQAAGEATALGDFGGPVEVIAQEIGRMERALQVWRERD